MRSYDLIVAAFCACSVAAMPAQGTVLGFGFAISAAQSSDQPEGKGEPQPVGGGGSCTEECCNVHPTPGCSDAACEALVCAAEPLCCVFEWDLACQMAALDLCGLESPSDCCGFLGPGLVCSDPECVEVVCAADPFCCDTSWDTLCGFEAQELCGDLCCCEEETHITICHIPPGNPGNAHTITISVNALPAHLAHGDTIGECPAPVCTSECCNVHPTPGCSDPECEALVCGVEPLCCVFEWDLACQMAALDLCGLESPSDCCGFIGPGAVCSDPACVAVVCAADPFCCDTSWDTLCGFEAQELCGGLCCCDEDAAAAGVLATVAPAAQAN